MEYIAMVIFELFLHEQTTYSVITTKCASFRTARYCKLRNHDVL